MKNDDDLLSGVKVSNGSRIYTRRRHKIKAKYTK